MGEPWRSKLPLVMEILTGKGLWMRGSIGGMKSSNWAPFKLRPLAHPAQ